MDRRFPGDDGVDWPSEPRKISEGAPMKIPVTVKHIRLRLVVEDDAEFILSLRTDELKSRHLSRVENDLEKQKMWIKEYKKREYAGEEYYFVFSDKAGERLGFFRIYDFKGDSFSLGSWMIKDGSPIHAAIESALAAFDFGFRQLGFSRSQFDVRKSNTRVVDFHRRFGALITSEDEFNYFFSFSKEKYLKIRQRFSRYFV